MTVYSGSVARFLLTAALLIGVLAAVGCSAPVVLLGDPYLELLSDGYSGFSQVRTVEGEPPWIDQLQKLVEQGGADYILSPLFIEDAPVLAAEHEQFNFYLLGTGFSSEPCCDNLHYIAIKRDEAIGQLAVWLEEYFESGSSDGNDGVVTVLYYTGTSSRQTELQQLRRLLDGYSGRQLRIQEYSSLPSRSVVEREVAAVADGAAQILVALLGMRTVDAVSLADEQRVPVIAENIGDGAGSSALLASIEYRFDQAAALVADNIRTGDWNTHPQAGFVVFEHNYID